ncbi:MAG: IS1634 family transposase [Melioribacteraceae bacterium]|nr:IS1634 family transposase [Melioribacteraceae bacterium]
MFFEGLNSADQSLKLPAIKTESACLDSKENATGIFSCENNVVKTKSNIKNLPAFISVNVIRKQVSCNELLELSQKQLILGKLYDEIGFNEIEEELFKELVISRIVFPLSKLKTSEYLLRYKNKQLEVDKIYRYLDKLESKQKSKVEQISFNHTLKLFKGNLSIVFYDVTTIYFESSDEDDLRKTGFSKDGKHQSPQIILGLLVSIDGYPLAYEVFEGNKFEGHTMIPVIESFKQKYDLKKLVIIADAAMLSKKNVAELIEKDYEFILGGRIKNESDQIKNKILSHHFSNGQSILIKRDENTNLIVNYSLSRAKKDAQNRQKGLKKLEKLLEKQRLTKKHLNNRGYNKYLKIDGTVKITIDYEKFKADGHWDGLKGYITNSEISKEEVIENYKHLWQIEKAFRISKTDLKVRPIYHR